jgi:hypothetical protein
LSLKELPALRILIVEDNTDIAEDRGDYSNKLEDFNAGAGALKKMGGIQKIK